MESKVNEQETTGGFVDNVRAAFDGGAIVGLIHGLFDGARAAWRTRPGDPTEVLGCLAGAVVIYSLLWIAVALLFSPLGFALWRRQTLTRRAANHAAILLGLALFLEMYWWMRPFVLPGIPALDPRRLAAAALLLPACIGAVWLLVRAMRLWRPWSQTASNAVAVVVIASWAGGLFFLSGQRAVNSERGKINDRNRDLPNVVLFVVDALRADMIAGTGATGMHTPAIDRLAARGVVFDNALVQAPFTWSSFGSILTGKYPRRHGLVKMAPGVRMAPNVTLPLHLKSARRLDGTALQDGDYFSAAFMTGTLSHGTGLVQGFDAYFEALVGHDLVEVDSPWKVFRSELLVYKTKNKLTQRLDPELVATEAARWLEQHSHRRFASMVHFYSTHTAYDPPEEYRKLYVDPDYGGPIQAFYAESRMAIEEGTYAPTPADKQQIANLYRGGVTQADAMIGRIVDVLEKQGCLDNTLIVVTSDHGEELGEHGVWEHNYMFQTNLHVPLVMSLPRALPAGTRIESLVESIDLVPTICAIAGLEPPSDPASAERGLIDGRNLLPLIRGEAPPPRELSFAENGRYLSVQDRRWKLIVEPDSLSEEGWQQATAGASEKPRLFDLETDPGEMHNALDLHPSEALRLLEALRGWDARMPIPRHEMLKSARDIETAALILRGLGYVDDLGAADTQGEPSGAEAPPR